MKMWIMWLVILLVVKVASAQPLTPAQTKEVFHIQAHYDV